jgi:hypothetical protein
LGLIHEVLLQQNARKIDIVAPAEGLEIISADDGWTGLYVTTDESHLDETGVTPITGHYTTSDIFDEGASDKLDIPIGYLRRTRQQHPDLYAANINGWLDKDPGRKFLVRLFRSESGGTGVARALLSDRFRVVDNLDVLMSVLDAIRATGMEVRVQRADLSDRRMTVHLVCEEVRALAPTLLKGYRNPLTGMTGEEDPTIFSGIRISNSETGGGAFTITPEFLVLVCTNGMTIAKDAIREVHLGGRLDEGVVKWSDDTQQRSLELVKAKTKDAVTTFLDVDYMTEVIARAEDKADEKIENAADTVKDVTKAAGFTEAQQQSILDYFVQSGQMTMGGIYNAATFFAQTVEDPDEAHLVDHRAAAILGL